MWTCRTRFSKIASFHDDLESSRFLHRPSTVLPQLPARQYYDILRRQQTHTPLLLFANYVAAFAATNSVAGGECSLKIGKCKMPELSIRFKQTMPLGIALKLRGGSLFVSEVKQGSIGEKSGIRTGDRVVKVNNNCFDDDGSKLLCEIRRLRKCEEELVLSCESVAAVTSSTKSMATKVNIKAPLDGENRYIQGQIRGLPTILDAFTGRLTTLPAPPESMSSGSVTMRTDQEDSRRSRSRGGNVTESSTSRLAGLLRGVFGRTKGQTANITNNSKSWHSDWVHCGSVGTRADDIVTCQGWLWAHGEPRIHDRKRPMITIDERRIHLAYGALFTNVAGQNPTLHLYDPPLTNSLFSRSRFTGMKAPVCHHADICRVALIFSE